MRRALLLAAATWLAACSSPPTQLLVVTDTDLAVPDGVDTIHLEVTGPDGVMHATDAMLGPASLPVTTRLVHEGGALGPVSVRAVARKSGGDVVDRTASVFFVDGQLRVLRLDLSHACIGRSCGMDTCAAGLCRPTMVDPGELEPWNGVVPPHTDGGTTDMPTCIPATEICNGLDDDCNGQVDETTNFRTDAHHCGSCTNDCGTMLPSGTAVCVLGMCDVACDATHEDCDGEYSNGCETSLNSPTDCGACDAMCMIAHATPGCSMAMCTIAACLPGWDTCDRALGPDLNGCEANVSTDPDRCGSCTHPCPVPPHASPICTDGTCDFVCDSGWADCAPSSGCESSLSVPATCGDCGTRCMGTTPLCSGDMLNGYTCTDACVPPTMQCGMSCVDTSQSTQNCGGCGMPCASYDHSAPTCIASSCGFTCDAFYGDCDGMMATGCEQSLRDPATCGSCTTPCAPAHASGVCGDGTCAIGACDPGYADCNGMVDDGCEVHVAADVLHCGTCPNACPVPPHTTPICDATSGCGIACDVGWGDCTPDPGCETDLRTSTDCGSCGVPCATGMLCSTDASGTAVCTSGCGSGGSDPHMICGGSCVDTSADPANCMSCGTVCPPATHASPACNAGACGLDCVSGFDDCDGMRSTGCETDLASTPAHCGSCPNSCPTAANATPTCSAGACGVVCNASYADCVPTAPGCETALGTTMNCTRCGESCMGGAHVLTNTCGATGCVLTCRSGYWNCDGVSTNGCEVHAASATSMCMACGTTPCP